VGVPARLAEHLPLRLDERLVNDQPAGAYGRGDSRHQRPVQEVEAADEIAGVWNPMRLCLKVDAARNHRHAAAAGEVFALRKGIGKDVPRLNVAAAQGQVDGVPP